MVVIHEYLLLLSAPACRSLHLMKINNILYSFRIRTKFILMGTCIVEFLHKVFSLFVVCFCFCFVFACLFVCVLAFIFILLFALSLFCFAFFLGWERG